MNPLLPACPTLAVSVIYCIYHAYRAALIREAARRRESARNQQHVVLRERVAYMLWRAAEQVH